MADYTKATGTGDMLIRDSGSTVYFYIRAGGSSTWVGSATYSWTMNGSGSGTWSYNDGGNYKLIRSATVSTDQTVTFAIGSTGTSGLGGPTSFSVFINRSSVPSATATPAISALTSTSWIAAFQDGANNGAAIDTRQLGWSGTSGSGYPDNLVTSDGSTQFSGFTPGTTYYVWARAHNSQGWGPWSGRRTVVTLRIPDAPDPVILSQITQSTMRTAFSGNGNGGAAVTQWQLGYGISPSAPQISVSSSGTLDISSLLPATTYYFWARGLNSVGWGPYSARTTARTVGGARVLVGGVWKEAIPYVRVGGIWKVAQPWGKIAGIWKKTG